MTTAVGHQGGGAPNPTYEETTDKQQADNGPSTTQARSAEDAGAGPRQSSATRRSTRRPISIALPSASPPSRPFYQHPDSPLRQLSTSGLRRAGRAITLLLMPLEAGRKWLEADGRGEHPEEPDLRGDV